MKSTAIAALVMALGAATAQPHHGHAHLHPARQLHGHDHARRGLSTEWVVEWETVTVTEYIDEQTTMLLGPTSTPSSPTTLATVVSTNTPAASAAEFYETPSVVASSSTTSSSTSTTPTPTPTTSSSTETPVVVEPTPTQQEEEETATASAAAAAETTAESSSSSSTSSSTSGIISAVEDILGSGYYSGDLTYYTVGLGACGEDDTGADDSSDIVAMSSDVMGSQSNGNPLCGKTIKIYNAANGKTATGKIKDKCPGCASGSIDVSTHLFDQLGDQADGRIDISWNYES